MKLRIPLVGMLELFPARDNVLSIFSNHVCNKHRVAETVGLRAPAQGIYVSCLACTESWVHDSTRGDNVCLCLLIPAPRRYRQKVQEFKVICYTFEASLDYMNVSLIRKKRKVNSIYKVRSKIN